MAMLFQGLGLFILWCALAGFDLSEGFFFLIGCLVLFAASSFFSSSRNKEKKVTQDSYNKQNKAKLILKVKNKLDNILLETYNTIIDAIFLHYSVLENKYNQTNFKDDYGNAVKDCWYNEIRYFVKNNVIKELKAKPLISSFIKQDRLLLLPGCKTLSMSFVIDANSKVNELKSIKPVINLNYMAKSKDKLKEVFYNDYFIDKIATGCPDHLLDEVISGKLNLNNKQSVKDYIKRYTEEVSTKSTKENLERISNTFHYIEEKCFKFDSNFLLNVEFLTKTVDEIFSNLYTRIKSDNINLLEKCNTISPYDFEKQCAVILKNIGYEAHSTKGSGDQGVDVVAKKDGKIIAIQCKQYSKPVGNKAVQEIIAGKDYYSAHYAVVVTNQSFTPSARKLANKCRVLLLNIKDLTKIEQYLNEASNAAE